MVAKAKVTKRKVAKRKVVKAKKMAPRNNGAKNLVIVESPAKARTIAPILGKDYTVAASLGHVRDLPKGKLGIDVDDNFKPSYLVMRPKAKVVKELKELGKDATAIYLATDPDREGEAISWHLVSAAGWDNDSKTVHRVVFHEITEKAIKEAFQHPRELDYNLIDAQQARRILDRLVGYQLSPLLWKKVQRGLSAGRVQSVALRQVVDREREIENFIPTEYWSIDANLAKDSSSFTAHLHSLKGERKKIEIFDAQRAREIESDLNGASYGVVNAKTVEKRRRPSPPFTTSTLQQEASRKLHFSAKKTMVVAQQLYEGLRLGDQGSVGLITYMRTDSTSLATSAVTEARSYISHRFGPEYLPKDSRAYRTKTKGAQEAHEAVRPTSPQRTPEQVKANLNRDQLRLYDLIWRRMVACQMADALFDATSVDIEAAPPSASASYIFRATGNQSKFPGFIALYIEGQDETPEASEDEESTLPRLAVGDTLDFLGLESKQHFTQPPPRFTEATLVKLLEAQGIGRPSTYAPILSTLVDRNYVLKEQNRLKPTILGTKVSELLTEFFPEIMDVTFTANMEDQLDDIAQGERPWVPMIEAFYAPFKKTLEAAEENMPRVRVEEPADEICDKCGSPMVIKTGRFGRFIACSTFPECRNTKPILKLTGAVCPKCGGDLVERHSRGKGRVFYGCAKYPACDFSVVQKPLPDPCPECDGLMVAKGRDRVACTICAWQGEPSEKEPVTTEV